MNVRSHSFLHLTAGLLAGLGAFACSNPAPPSQDDAPSPGARLPYYADGTFTPHWFASPAEVPSSFHRIRPFRLSDQRGELITERDLEGKYVVANFFFATCSGICPMTMASMSRLQDEFANDRDVILLSHSVTPEIDSVAALKAFAERMRAVASKWYMATGEREVIYDLGKNFYFAHENLGEEQEGTVEGVSEGAFLHTENFFLVDQDRRIRGIYNGMNKTAVAQLMDDVRALQLAGAGLGR